VCHLRPQRSLILLNITTATLPTGLKTTCNNLVIVLFFSMYTDEIQTRLANSRVQNNQQQQSSKLNCRGYVIVGDNFDKNFAQATS